jgi:hypothetical protein
MSLTGKDPLVLANHQKGVVKMLRVGAYTNLNDIAKPFGKRVDNWMRLKTTKELIEHFNQERSYNGVTPIYAVKGFSDLPSHLRDALESTADEEFKRHGGTFAHPDIAIQFAQWCSPGFALWVSRQIRHLLTYGEVNIHYTEWSENQRLTGLSYNRDDIKEMYYR